MPTPNLAITYVASNQNQKEVTINAGFDALDDAANNSGVVDCTAGGTVTVDPLVYTRVVNLRLAGLPASAFTLQVPSTKRMFMVSNESGRTASVRVSGGATVTPLDNGSRGIFINLGTDVLPVVITTGTGGGGALASDGDVVITTPADGDVLEYDGAHWRNQRRHYIIGDCSLVGTLLSNQVLLYHPFTKAVTIKANFGQIRGHANRAGGSANATASTVISVDRALAASPNSFTQIGTITIAAGGVAATFATTGGTDKTIAQGDVLRLTAPNTPDATFADFYASLVGYET